MVRKLKDRIGARYRVPISEVSGQNTWQRIGLGFALVGSDRTAVEAKLADIVHFIGQVSGTDPIGDEREILSYGDSPIGDAANEAALLAKVDASSESTPGPGPEPLDESWIPESWKSEEFS